MTTFRFFDPNSMRVRFILLTLNLSTLFSEGKITKIEMFDVAGSLKCYLHLA